MSFPTQKKIEFRNKLVSNATRAELKLFWELSKRKIKFEFQTIILGFIVDFYFPDKKLVVELDGESHKDKKEYDEKRTSALLKTNQVKKVIRFSNDRVFKNANNVCAKILTSDIKKSKQTKKTDRNKKYGINKLAMKSHFKAKKENKQK